MVRCKFVVDSVEKTRYGVDNVKLSAVTQDSEENKQFWHYTPSGRVDLQTTNHEAADQFKVGMHFYVDFSPAP